MTFCTGWQQFRVLTFQRVCLEREFDPAFMKVKQVSKKALRSHDRNEDELSFAKTVAAVAPSATTCRRSKCCAFCCFPSASSCSLAKATTSTSKTC